MATRRKDDTDDDPDIVTKAKAFRRRSATHYATWRIEAREDYGFVSGQDQWTEDDKSKLNEQLRPIVTFNRVGPVVDAVSGAEVSNRQEVRYIPRQVGDSQVNEVLTGAADFIRDECDAEDEESDAFMDTVICGLGCTETYMDYSEDPEGMTRIDRVDVVAEIYPDPSAKKRDLADMKEVGRLKFMRPEEVKKKWPDKADEIDAYVDGMPDDAEGPKQPDIVSPQDDYDEPDIAQGQTTKKRVPVFDYQYCTYETAYIVADPAQNKTIELKAGQFNRLKKRTEQMGIQLKFAKQDRAVWYRAFICGDVELEHEKAPCPFTSTYKFITGKRDRNTNTWYGLVRPMKDPQRWANKFFSSVLHTINTSGKGIIVETDAIDPRKTREFEDKWASADSVAWVKPGGSQKIQPKQPQPVTPGIPQMMEFAVSSIRDVTGVNLEMLGLADRQQAGVLEYQRKQAGLTILASLFDSLRRYRKMQGRLLLHFIQNYMSDGRLVRITGGDGMEKYVPLAKDQQAARFDVIVDEAPTSPNQKEKTFAILMQMLPAVADKIPPQMWPEIIRYSPLPSSFSDKLNQVMQEASQQPPPPDPKMELEKFKAQTEAQRIQMEGQIKEREMQGEAMLNQQKMQMETERNAFEREKMEHERQMAMMTGQTEVMKAGFEREKMGMEAQRTAGENETKQLEIRAKNAEGLSAADAIDGVAKAAKDALSETTAQLKTVAGQMDGIGKTVAEIVQQANAPRTIVRKNGKATAVKIGNRERAIARNPDGSVTIQ